jgi:hypothetical protein
MKKTKMQSIALTVLFYSTFLTTYYRERYIFSPKFNDDINFFYFLHISQPFPCSGTGKTPLPVVAQWFTHSDLGSKT